MSIFLLAFTACANGSKGTKASNKGELSDMKISIQITSDSGSHSLAATLADNSSAMAFYELLEKGPVTIKMTDYGNFEKVFAWNITSSKRYTDYHTSRRHYLVSGKSDYDLLRH